LSTALLFSPSFYVLLFLFMLCFFSVVFSVFYLCFWVDFCVFVLYVLLPFIETQRIASNQSCLCRTVIFHERDYRRETWSTLDRTRCRFSAYWIGMEKTNTAVPPATVVFRQQGIPPAMTTFQQQWTFSFWPLNFGNSAIGPLIN